MSGNIVREIARDGTIVISDARCKFIFERLRGGALELRIIGSDNGQFGAAIIDEVAVALLRERSLKLFLDASEASMPPANVTRAWATFFELNRDKIARVSILASSKPVALAMAIVRHLSKTGHLIHIHSERARYEESLSALKVAREAQRITPIVDR